MRDLMNFYGLWIRVLNPLMVGVLVVAAVVGMAGPVDAQTSRYTLEDVMDKLLEMDKKFEVRLGKLETRVSHIEADMKADKAELREQMKADKAELRAQIADVETHLDNRINTANTITMSFFTVLAVLFGGILVSVISIARNMRPAESSKAFRKEVKAIAERERALEEKLQAMDRSVPKEARVLEVFGKELRALAERQKELEGRLKLAEEGLT